MDHDVPRISISSMRVWLRIKSEFTREVQKKVDLHSKQHNFSPRRRDDMLKGAQQYVDETFKVAQSNIRINGRDYESLQAHEQDAEPFDEALDRKIWALASSRLEWHRKIAIERREKPLILEDTLHELVKEHETLDVELEEEPPLPDAEVDDSPRLEVDQSVIGQIFAVAGELSQTLPNQRERSERSKAVEAEFKALKP
ncbi:hypothetical protein DFH06DRAFT_1300954 [Mycena polygramma]|nr:hypothetical protein DFH06DRAFT_1300954 [Mycena polygramma]